MSSSRLPPIEQNRGIVDWSSWTFECPNCRGKRFPLPQLNRHQKWHSRVHLLSHIRTLVKRDVEETPHFGPTSLPGCFLELVCSDGDRMLKIGVSEEDVRDYLKRLSKKGALVTLNYVEGRKYTVGNEFLGRESQGDFIYLGMTEQDDSKDKSVGLNPSQGENYFELQCKGDGCWISTGNVEATRPSTIISVNGVSIQERGCEEKCNIGTLTSERKLQFGDIVTISTGVDEHSVETYCDLVFKASISPGLKPLVSQISEEDSFTSLDNPLIVETILHFLPTKILRQLRYLAHIWNREALKVLRTRVALSICSLGWKKFPSSNDLLQISNVSHSQLSVLNFPSWKIVLPMTTKPKRKIEDLLCGEVKLESGAIERRKAFTDRKVLEDLTWFLSAHPRDKLSNLQLSGKLENQIRFNMFDTVLRSLQGGLSSLTLKVGCLEKDLFTQPLEKMGCLQSLSLAFNSSGDNVVRSLLEDFLKWFLPAVDNIHILTLRNYSLPRLSGYGSSRTLANLVLTQLNVIRRASEGPFSNLTRVTVACGDTSPESLDLPLSVVNVGLVELALGENFIGRQFHRNHLVLLTLHFNCNRRSGMVDAGDALSLHFPERMTSLKSLSLYFSLSPHATPIRFRMVEDRRPRPTIDYREAFPCLSHLTVWPVECAEDFVDGFVRSETTTSWDAFGPVLTAFVLPYRCDPSMPVPTVRTLDIPFFLEGKYNRRLDNLEIMYPNVEFTQELAAAREQPLWVADRRGRTGEAGSSRRRGARGGRRGSGGSRGRQLYFRVLDCLR